MIWLRSFSVLLTFCLIAEGAVPAAALQLPGVSLRGPMEAFEQQAIPPAAREVITPVISTAGAQRRLEATAVRGLVVEAHPSWICRSWAQFFFRYPRLKRVRDVYRWTRGSIVTAWYWQHASSPRKIQRAIDASYEHRYIGRYRSSRDPEFFPPRIPFWQENAKVAESAKETVTGFVSILIPYLDFIKAIIILLEDRLRPLLADRLSRLGTTNPLLVEQALADIEHATSLNERRRLLRGYFRRTGYWVTDLIRATFPAFDPTHLSNEIYASPRELNIQELEGYFLGLMQWKKRLISDTKDLEILDFLIARLEDPDPFVVKAAIRAIGVVNDYLLPADKDELLMKYEHLLLTHPSEVVQGAIARDLSQELVDSDNVRIIERALQRGGYSPMVEGYLAESLELLLKDNPPRRNANPEWYDALLSLLLARAVDVHLTAPARKSFLRALVRLRPSDADTFLRIKELLLNDAEPTIQDASVWALASLGAAADDQRLKIVVETLFIVGAGSHLGRPNPHLEHYALELAEDLVEVIKDNKNVDVTDLMAQVKATQSRPAVSSDNPIYYLVLDGNLPGTDLDVAAEIRKILRVHEATVVFADSFREDRDRAHMVSVRDPDHPALELHTEALIEALDAVGSNRQARMPLWDPKRGKVATRMEIILCPVPGKPVVLFGRDSEFELIQSQLKRPIKKLHISDLWNDGKFDMKPLEAPPQQSFSPVEPRIRTGS